jgi:hypothetical protein
MEVWSLKIADRSLSGLHRTQKRVFEIAGIRERRRRIAGG